MITVNNVLRVFPGAIVVRLDLVCEHCGDKARCQGGMAKP